MRPQLYDRLRDVLRQWGLEAWAMDQPFAVVIRKPEFIKAMEALIEEERRMEANQ